MATQEAARAEIAPPDRYNEYTQYWYTAADLVRNGYREDTLHEVFGLPVPLPDGRLVWPVSMVEKIEAEVLAPSAAVVLRAFSNWDYVRDIGGSRWWIDAQFEWPLTPEGRAAVEERMQPS
ncbi:hypothetical protein [Nocardia terpenica]|uniref:Uncharacterized protein n=1 Tax=Nocardia terpenica TaxID=455432 RepID=A0A291RRA8_9NOCA|nr:hypothetical protein [Nocardia terpenica]ATL69875.1 hypothetical protein CRH09_30585 [Nocardia terpenica]